jgi:hypothetical protein
VDVVSKQEKDKINIPVPIINVIPEGGNNPIESIEYVVRTPQVSRLLTLIFRIELKLLGSRNRKAKIFRSLIP